MTCYLGTEQRQNLKIPVVAQLTVAILFTEGLALTNAALVCGLCKRRGQKLATIWSQMIRM
jgi:hypothetical protein